MAPTSAMPSKIVPIASLTPPSTARTWHTTPHPYLPLCATSSSDRTVRIYSLRNFALHSTVSGGHKRSIRASAWKPNTASTNESVLATGSFDASAGIWRRYDNQTEGMIEDFTSGGNGENDDDDDEWRFSVILDGHESEIKSVAWSAGGQYLATCSRDKSVWVWEEMGDDNFETVAVMQEHDGDVKCVAWHPTEELLASASYDDTVRLYREDIDDWTCCAVMQHDATAWYLDFERAEVVPPRDEEHDGVSGEEKRAWKEERELSGPRLISCSDDLSIRIWRRIPKEKTEAPTGQGRMPSILRTNSVEEQWVEEVRLPQLHERSVYAVSWSRQTGMIVSAGSDGKIIVYRERWRQESFGDATTELHADVEMANGSTGPAKAAESATEWIVVAEISDAHDIWEINHVCWSKRWDKARKHDNEEMILSTGDDGEVKAWELD